MKRLLYLFAFIAAFSIIFSSCQPCVDGMGLVSEKNVDVKGFSKLDIRVPAKVVLRFGDAPVATIKSNENILKIIDAKIKGKTLVIDSKQCIGDVDKLRIDIIVRDLDEIILNGSGSVKSISQLKADNMLLVINGSGNIMCEVFTKKLDVDINGSGDVITNGTTKDLNVGINGSGNFKAMGLQSFSADIEINGSGSARVNTNEKLRVDIKGSGSVLYSGNPKIRTNISGSGEVKKINE